MLKTTGSGQHNLAKKNTRTNKILKRSCLALAISQSLLLTAQAADILVTVGGDVDFLDMDCTLREAVQSANTNDAGGSGCISGSEMGIDTISFDPNLTNTTITLTQASPVQITSNISINGLGRDQLAVSGNGNAGVFNISYNSMVTIQDLTIQGASVGTGSNAFDGAGIRVAQGNLDLKNCLVYNNTTDQSGGGVFVTTYASLTVDSCIFRNNTAFIGGAILNRGIANISNSTIAGNSSTNSVGGIAHAPYAYNTSATMSITNSTITGNSAGFSGGGVRASGNLVHIRNSTITGNSAVAYGGGIVVNLEGALSISNSIVSGNQAPAMAQGAEVRAQSVNAITANNNNIFGEDSLNAAAAFYRFTPGMTDIMATNDNPATAAALQDIILAKDDSNGYRAYFILPDGSPALTAANPTVCSSAPVNGLDQRGLPRDANCDIGATEFATATLLVDSKDDGTGGANCTMASAMLSANRRIADGGCARGGDDTTINFDATVFPSNANNIILLNEPLEEIETSTVTINGRGNPGVTLQAVAGEYAAGNQVLDFSSSTVSLNRLVLTGGSGGLLVDNSSELSISDSTVSGNLGASFGGGIAVDNNSRLVVNRSTITGNVANRGGGGIELYRASYLRLSNSTVSNNSQTDASSDYGGGGIALDFKDEDDPNGDSAVIINSTITGNQAATSGGGIFLYDTGQHQISITNSIVSGNSATASAQEISGGSNSVTSLGNNLFGSAESNRAAAFFVTSGMFPSATDLDGSDGYLNLSLASIIEPLAQNGGFTRTHALAEDSRAINAANNALCASAGISTDQRGNPRNDGRCDIGAFEIPGGESCYVVKAANGSVLAFCL